MQDLKGSIFLSLFFLKPDQYCVPPKAQYGLLNTGTGKTIHSFYTYKFILGKWKKAVKQNEGQNLEGVTQTILRGHLCSGVLQKCSRHKSDHSPRMDVAPGVLPLSHQKL